MGCFARHPRHLVAVEGRHFCLGLLGRGIANEFSEDRACLQLPTYRPGVRCVVRLDHLIMLLWLIALIVRLPDHQDLLQSVQIVEQGAHWLIELGFQMLLHHVGGL